MIETLVICATLVAFDGDTIKCDGQLMRDMGDGAPFVSGYDAPETRDAKCQVELELGRAATALMEKLLPTARIYDSGQRDRFDRPLVWVRMPDGRSIGSIMIEEGLARPWPGGEKFWCE